MFMDATAFKGDISNWDVSSVTTMFGMFNNATSFDQDLSGWKMADGSSCIITDMFLGAGLSIQNNNSIWKDWNGYPMYYSDASLTDASLNEPSWFPVVAGTAGAYWRSITSNATGSQLAAVEYYGYIWMSIDYGATWTDISNGNMSSSKEWNSITSNATGSLLAAVEGGFHDDGNAPGYIWTSIDYGATWTEISNGNISSSKQWSSITSNATGSLLAACENGGYIWTSNDFGVTWTDISTGNMSSTKNWNGITSNATGSHLAAVENGGYIWWSIDYGTTWTDTSNSFASYGPQNWYGITSNSGAPTSQLS